MSDCVSKTLKHTFSLDKKLEYLKEIRREIKKKRLFFDESKDKFGMDEMSQLIKVKNTSEVKGYPFKVSKVDSQVMHGIKLAIKIMPVETKYEKRDHPCNLENIALKELTDKIVLKDISPHITYYLGTQKVSNKCRALKPLNLKRLEVEEKVRTHSIMLLSEFVPGGSLDNWIFETYENDKTISDEVWKSIIFQLIYTIAVIQHYYKMMHNDFHYGNVLIDDSIQPGGYFVYQIANKNFYIKNTGIIPKLWDFEFNMVYSNKIPESYPNKLITGNLLYDKKTNVTIIDPQLLDKDEIYNVPHNYNEVYDLHFFLTSLLDLCVSQELFDFIISIYPNELIPDDDSSNITDASSSNTTTTRTNSDSDSDTKSDSSSNKSTKSFSSDSCSDSPELIHLGRLINDVEKQYDLPSPMTLINHPFFESFTKVPKDFEEKTAKYFKSGI